MSVSETNKKLHSCQAEAYDNLPFFDPEYYGFMGCKPPDGEGPCLELSLFPHNSSVRITESSNEGEKLYHEALLKACGISDVNAALTNESFTKMPGLIIAGSLAGPIIDKPANSLLYSDDELTSITIPPANGNVLSWVNGYPCAILNMIISQTLINLPPSATKKVNAGFNYFFDTTDCSLISTRFKLARLIGSWEIAEPNVRIGEESLADTIKLIKKEVIFILKKKFEDFALTMGTTYDDMDISYNDFLIIGIYTISSYLNQPGITSEYRNGTVAVGSTNDLDAITSPFLSKNEQVNLPIRMYSYRRLGRFKWDGDTNKPGTNKSKICWLGIGQYIRYISWTQDKFKIGETTYFPCKDVMYRDGHSTCPSMLSSKLDREVFNAPDNINILLAARAINYRQVHHIVLDKDVDTKAKPQDKILALSAIDDTKPERHYKLGTWAGLYNSKNINALREDGSCIFISDNWLRQPFIDTLIENFPETIPPNSLTHKDAFAPKDTNNTYWGYGLDEHVLGYMFKNAIDKIEPKVPLRILFYNIFYGQDYFSGMGQSNLANTTDLNEYWKPLYGYMFSVINKYFANKGIPIPNTVTTDKGLEDFLKRTPLDKDFLHTIFANLEEKGVFGPQLILITMFGGTPNANYRKNDSLFKLMGYIEEKDSSNKVKKDEFGNTIFKRIFNTKMETLLGKTDEQIKGMKYYGLFLRDFEKFKSRIENIHRYDRYDYYNYPSPTDAKGAPLMVTNATGSFIENLRTALNLEDDQLLPLSTQVTLKPEGKKRFLLDDPFYSKVVIGSVAHGGRRRITHSRKGLKTIYTRRR
jgi:hypothetical protein